MANKKVLITGGTGLVGTHLIPLLKNEGYDVAVLTRNPTKLTDIKAYQWDLKTGSIDQEAIEWADIIVHLAGANVGEKRWSAKRKEIILKSRTESTQLLKKSIKESGKKDMVFVSASAIGIYQTNTGQKLNEDGPEGNDFLAEVTKAWEKEASSIAPLVKKVAYVRTGVVFSKDGGAFTQLTLPVKLYAGAPLGSGKQMTSWIHIDDLCRIFVEAIQNDELEGPINAAAPEAETNKAVTKTIAQVMKKPLWLPNVPGFMLKVLLGEMATVVLSSCHVYPKKLIDKGFTFKFASLKPAVEDLLSKK